MEQLITQLAAATTSRTLYPANHPRVLTAINSTIETLEKLVTAKDNDSVTLLIVGDDLVIDNDVLRKETLSQLQLVELLKRRGIERLTLASGVGPEELDQLLLGLASGDPLETTAHVIIGRVQLVVDDDAEESDLEKRELTLDQLESVREAFANFRTAQKLPLNDIEELVWGFIDSMSRTTRGILPLARLREHDEYTFVHSVNVALLVLAQARAFGVSGRTLHMFGTAALLHDIGKLMVPLDVLNCPGKLEGEQWSIMQSHAEQGAWYLSSIGGATQLAMLVAFEHHLRYDGQPNYPVLKRPRQPNLISRMTAIADAYDAMQTVRPYQKPLMRNAALEIIGKRVGTFYDPVLVASFRQVIEANAR